MTLDLRQLRHVLAIDQHRNFARAANAVGLTQPALSRSLQSLERSLGARLFDRSRTRVEPTPIGERLIERARQLLNQARSLEHDLQQLLGLEVGLLRIGAGPYPADLSVGTTVGRLVQRHPGLMVDLTVGDWPDLLRRVVSDELDVAVVETEVAKNDVRLVVESLPQHRISFFCRAGHPLLDEANLTLGAVRRYPLVAPALPRRLSALGAKDNHGVRSDLPEGTVAPEVRVGSFSLVQRIVAESDLIGGATRTQIAGAEARGQLARLELDLPWLSTTYGIIRRADRTPSPAAEAFMSILRAVEAEIARA